MDWNRFLDKNISQDENDDDVFDDDDDEALVTLCTFEIDILQGNISSKAKDFLNVFCQF
jgi:hypothetical protein